MTTVALQTKSGDLSATLVDVGSIDPSAKAWTGRQVAGNAVAVFKLAERVDGAGTPAPQREAGRINGRAAAAQATRAVKPSDSRHPTPSTTAPAPRPAPVLAGGSDDWESF